MKRVSKTQIKLNKALRNHHVIIHCPWAKETVARLEALKLLRRYLAHL